MVNRQTNTAIAPQGLANQSPTINDIAARARVSSTTVSFVLHPPPGRQRVSPRTRQRVLQAVSALQYRPSLSARGLRLGRALNIGFYINRPEYLNLTEPGWHRMYAALLERSWQHGYQVGFYFFEPGNREGFRTFLTPHRVVDGIVVQGRNLDAKEIAAIRASGLRTVSLYEKIDGFWSLEIDQFGVGQRAAEYFYACGHRQVALMAQRIRVERWAGRVSGFLSRAAELGLEVPEPAQFYWEDSDQFAAGRQAGRELFRRYRASGTPIRCLYVPSDYLAFGVVEGIDEQGWRLGRDISLLSYDNLEGNGTAPWPTPRLTSYDPPYRAIGEKAADILAGQPEAEAPTHQLFQPQLVVRDSVAEVQ